MPKLLKQVRFDDLVSGSGNPEQVTLWAKPDAGSPFVKAVEENRVATVVQHNTGTKKDFGVIGFETLPNATFLLFPKPLPYAAGTKIVGIKYERLSESAPKGPLYKPAATKPATAKQKEPIRAIVVDEPAAAAAKPSPPTKPVPAPPAPKPAVVHRFRATVELVARQSVEIEVSATSLKEATDKLKAESERLALEPAKAEVTRRVSSRLRKIETPSSAGNKMLPHLNR